MSAKPQWPRSRQRQKVMADKAVAHHLTSGESSQAELLEAPPDFNAAPAQINRPVPGGLSRANILQLQSTIGNQAVMRLLAKQKSTKTIQRALTEYTPSAPTINDTTRRTEIKTHVSEAFKEEAILIGSMIKFYEDKFDEGSSQGEAFLTEVKELLRELKGDTAEVAALEARIKTIADLATLWGGVDGLTTLIKGRMGKIFEMINDELKKPMLDSKKDHYQDWKKPLVEFTTANPANIKAKLTNFSQWYKKRTEEVLDDKFSWSDAVKGLKASEVKSEGSVWKNEFYFPKVSGKLGLPRGTGQQLYTNDHNYNPTYTWHISVAFVSVPGKVQTVKINQIHVSFKNAAVAVEPRQWFTINGNDLSEGVPSGGANAAMITFAKNKVRAWAQSYTGFNVTF